MKANFAFVSLAVGFFTLSCVQRQFHENSDVQSVTKENEGYPSPATCAESETAMTYHLAGVVSVARTDVGLEGADLNLVQQVENDASGYRLDLCCNTTTGTVYLKRMVQRRARMSAFNTAYIEMTPKRSEPDAALVSALGGGTTKDIEIVFENKKQPSQSYLLKGWTTAQGKPFVTVSKYNRSKGKPLVASDSEVKFGALVEGDPWITTFKPNNRRIAKDTLLIELWYDVRDGSNNYKTYRVNRIHILDKHPKLSKPFESLIEGEQLASALKINETHHSLSDQFEINFPHAAYVIGGGGVQVNYSAESGIPVFDAEVQCTEVANCGEPF